MALYTHTHTLYLENKKIGSKESLKNRNARLEVKNKERGITLIALVITIVVLLILASVSISMLTGENGILTQASNAKKATEESTEQEKRQLSQVEASTHLENYDYTDAEGAIAKIPAGFAVSSIEGENLVSKGLVIIGSTGNEYVWIPCTTDANDTSKLQYKRETEEWYTEGDYNTLATKDELTLTGTTPSKEESDNEITTTVLNEIVEQVKNEIASVKTNGGYYIGRYEVGKAEDNRAVVKAKQNTYVSIKWRNGYEIAKKMENSTKIKSYLCSSYAWDTAVHFIQEHSNAKNYGSTIEGLNGNWYSQQVKDKSGNIIKKINSDEKLKTGMTTPFANIYDIGGNASEFTTELNPNTSEIIILRGAYYYGDYAAGGRCDVASGSNGHFYCGFRNTIFLE